MKEYANPELIGLSYSPWTEKARWALDYSGVGYRFHEHLVIFGMPWLRYKTKCWREPLTVPVLIHGSGVLKDSFEIAKAADGWGNSKYKQFSPQHLAEIQRWNELSETMLDAGRALVLENVARSPQAQIENLPAFLLPRYTKGLFRPLALVGIAYLRREFDVNSKSLLDYEQILENGLQKLEAELKRSSSGFICGDGFTYADITMAAALHFVCPPQHAAVAIGPGNRACFRHERLSQRFLNLLQWRDGLYKRWRGGSAFSI